MSLLTETMRKIMTMTTVAYVWQQCVEQVVFCWGSRVLCCCVVLLLQAPAFAVGDQVVVVVPHLARHPKVRTSAERAGVFKGVVCYIGAVGFADGVYAGVALANKGTETAPPR